MVLPADLQNIFDENVLLALVILTFVCVYVYIFIQIQMQIKSLHFHHYNSLIQYDFNIGPRPSTVNLGIVTGR